MCDNNIYYNYIKLMYNTLHYNYYNWGMFLHSKPKNKLYTLHRLDLNHIDNSVRDFLASFIGLLFGMI